MAAECGFAAAIASPLLESCKLVFGPLHRNIKSFFKLQSNLTSLQHKKGVLREMEEDVKKDLEAADKDGKSPTPQAKEWLRQAREILVVADQMEPGMTANHRGLVSGCFLSCGVCKKVSKTLEAVEGLMRSDAYPAERVVSTNRPPPTIQHIPGPSFQDQSTAAQNLIHVMDLLSRDEVRSIGVWGMGGVGKTTLVRNLNNKLEMYGSSSQKFGMVIWVTVSKDFNRKRVQTQIANRLKLVVGESDEDRLAIRLHERLQREEKFLLILDDAWNPIHLDVLGVPYPEDHKGCKILLTTRSREVCTQMNMDQEFKIAVLKDEEAWQLFKTSTGEVASSEQILPFAKDVARECCGLPLAIVIVGAAMRRKERVELWKDALNELRRSRPSVSGIEEEVFNPLKWSYDSLQGESIKACFLFCCLYPEDHEIDVNELVQCWIGEGLIDEQLDHENSLNRGLALVENLKDACLLETVRAMCSVKMHDVVRDVAIWIASSPEHECKHLARGGVGITEVDELEFAKDVTRVSLMHNKIEKLPGDGCGIVCSNASTLFLQGNYSLQEIPKQFLRGFPAIRILNLSETNISSINSIMELVHLRTLVLSNCGELQELPSSGWEALKRMQVLDLSNTGVKELPRDMGMLIKLRELNLSETRSLKSISAGVFTMSSPLEVLEMSGSSYLWGLKGTVEDGEAHLEELESLNRLRVLLIELKRGASFSWVINHTWIGRLTRFKFHTNTILIAGFFQGEKEILMGGTDVAEERVEYMLTTTKATSLWFNRCEGLDKLVQNMGLNTTSSCFSDLKLLNIRNASIDFRASLGGGHGAKHDLLPNLVNLGLENVSGLRSISDLAGLLGLTFTKLQRLDVQGCNEMKYLLSFGHHLVLEGLTEMFISRCSELKEVFKYVAHPQGHSVGVVPNLKKVELFELPKLRTLCHNHKAETWPSLEIIMVLDCFKLRKLPICSQNNSIKQIKGEKPWWDNLQWSVPNTKLSLQHLYKEKSY